MSTKNKADDKKIVLRRFIAVLSMNKRDCYRNASPCRLYCLANTIFYKLCKETNATVTLMTFKLSKESNTMSYINDM